MPSRKTIALHYDLRNDEEVALVIYIQNLIQGFSLLEESRQPKLVVISGSNTPPANLTAIDQLRYPHLQHYHYSPPSYSIPERLLNKTSRALAGRNLIVKTRPDFPRDLDCLYPHVPYPEASYLKRRVYWVADYQQKHYPQYFSRSELAGFEAHLQRITSSADHVLVCSSQDALRDFQRYYPDHRNALFVLPFIAFVPYPRNLDESALLRRHGIHSPYFLVCNQFWPHKNHRVVFQALRHLVAQHPEVCVVCTGKLSSYRQPDYHATLLRYLRENALDDHVHFLGFVPREEQLVLIKNSLAVIQPSLFEGWSTIVEEVKALNHFVILSDLPVHQEQIASHCRFFERHNDAMLAAELSEVLQQGTPRGEPYDYAREIQAFQQNLTQLFQL